MNWDAVGAIGEIVGAAAVVASLIYLAVQTRANARALRANAIWQAETAFGDLNFSHAENPEFAELAHRAFSPDASIQDFTTTEVSQLELAVRGALQYNQAQYSLWREGILPDELWERRRKFIQFFVSLPVLGELWAREMQRHNVSQDFKAAVESGR